MLKQVLNNQAEIEQFEKGNPLKELLTLHSSPIQNPIGPVPSSQASYVNFPQNQPFQTLQTHRITTTADLPRPGTIIVLPQLSHLATSPNVAEYLRVQTSHTFRIYPLPEKILIRAYYETNNGNVVIDFYPVLDYRVANAISEGMGRSAKAKMVKMADCGWRELVWYDEGEQGGPGWDREDGKSWHISEAGNAGGKIDTLLCWNWDYREGVYSVFGESARVELHRGDFYQVYNPSCRLPQTELRNLKDHVCNVMLYYIAPPPSPTPSTMNRPTAGHGFPKYSPRIGHYTNAQRNRQSKMLEWPLDFGNPRTTPNWECLGVESGNDGDDEADGYEVVKVRKGRFALLKKPKWAIGVERWLDSMDMVWERW